MARILVADDDRAVRGMVTFKLRQLGHEPIDAEDGLQTIALATGERPDLIILDVVMPRLNGLEVLRRLKSDAAVQAVPVIMLSVKGRERDVADAFHEGAADYVVKPFSLKDLGARVEWTLRDRHGDLPAHLEAAALDENEQARSEMVRCGSGADSPR